VSRLCPGISLVTKFASEKFAKKLLGESEIEAVLQRLDRLTLDEARMTRTETLQVVHGLLSNIKLVMDGKQSLLGSFSIFRWTGSSRRQDIDGRHTACSRYVQPTVCVCLSDCGLLVAMQEMTSEINKMKRWSFTRTTGHRQI
jgi:hypothetical protein